MADVQGMISDPAFQALDPTVQRQALSRLDPSFGSLNDQQFQEFKSRVARQTIPGMEKLGGKAPSVAPVSTPYTQALPPVQSNIHPMTFGQKLLQNLPISLAKLPEDLVANTPGAPYSGPEETLTPGGALPDYNQGVKDYWHNLSQAVSNPSETFASDPVGTLTNIASAVAGFGRSGGGSAIKEGVQAGMHTPGSVPLSVTGSLAGAPFGPKWEAKLAGMGYAAPKVIEGLKTGVQELHAPGLIRDPIEPISPEPTSSPSSPQGGSPVPSSPRAVETGNKFEAARQAKDLAIAQRLKTMNLDPTNLSDAELNTHLRALGKKELGKGGAYGRDASTTRADIIQAFRGLK
jgi:hypothetical protein